MNIIYKKFANDKFRDTEPKPDLCPLQPNKRQGVCADSHITPRHQLQPCERSVYVNVILRGKLVEYYATVFIEVKKRHQ